MSSWGYQKLRIVVNKRLLLISRGLVTLVLIMEFVLIYLRVASMWILYFIFMVNWPLFNLLLLRGSVVFSLVIVIVVIPGSWERDFSLVIVIVIIPGLGLVLVLGLGVVGLLFGLGVLLRRFIRLEMFSWSWLGVGIVMRVEIIVGVFFPFVRLILRLFMGGITLSVSILLSLLVAMICDWFCLVMASSSVLRLVLPCLGQNKLTCLAAAASPTIDFRRNTMLSERH